MTVSAMAGKPRSGPIDAAEPRGWTASRRTAGVAGIARRRTVGVAGAAPLCPDLSAWASRPAADLPSRYVTGHRDVARVGFDVSTANGTAPEWRR